MPSSSTEVLPNFGSGGDGDEVTALMKEITELLAKEAVTVFPQEQWNFSTTSPCQNTRGE